MTKLDLQVVLEALRDKHRRRLLVELLEHNPQDDVPVPEGIRVGEKELELLRGEMYHNHLPMLEEAGIIQ